MRTKATSPAETNNPAAVPIKTRLFLSSLIAYTILRPTSGRAGQALAVSPCTNNPEFVPASKRPLGVRKRART